jgi:hypothetical protein
MTTHRVKAGSIFYKGKRIATMQNVSYTINTNDTQELADDGPYTTDGRAVTEVSCNVIVPVRGVGVSVVSDAIAHRDVDLSLGILDGAIHELKSCRARTIKFDGEIASGKLTGTFDWFGPAPTIKGL